MKLHLDSNPALRQKQRGSAIVYVVLGIIVLSMAAAVLFFEPKEQSSVRPKPVQKLSPIEAPKQLAVALPEVTVYKSSTCDCCSKWVTHLENEGFKVVSHNTDDLNRIKQEAGLTPGLASCHTALIGDYVIEGHVPASDIKRLLLEKPAVLGLTAPGMPQASPGMQPEGLAPKGYDVLAFDKEGNTGVFSRY